jgi:enoyl-CoA hydratase
MPEAGIGLFGDVGVNAILSKAPVQRALLFLMSGIHVGAADALALGLTDCAVAPARLAELRADLIAAASAGNLESAIVGLMQAHSIQAGERSLCPLADLLSDALHHDNAAAIVDAIAEAAEEIPEAVAIAAVLKTRSPTSLEVILQSHLAARRLHDVRSVLALDLRLARLMAALPDFSEGVRAALVDKDRSPRWDPASFAGVPTAAILDAVAEATAAVPV